MKNLINASIAIIFTLFVLGIFSLFCYSAVVDSKKYAKIEKKMESNLGRRVYLMDTLLIVDFDLGSEKYHLMNRNQEKAWLKKEVVEKNIVF